MASDIINNEDLITSYTLLAAEFLLITDTGILRNNPTTVTITGGGAEVVNDGLIFSLAGFGIWIQAASARIDNAGRIIGTSGIAVQPPAGTRASIVNTGDISADFDAITGSRFTLLNEGRITGGATGVEVLGAEALITNNGLIAGDFGISLYGSVAGFNLLNQGTVSGNLRAIGYVGDDGPATGDIVIVNAGTLSSSQSTAIELGLGTHRITNTGLISAPGGFAALDLDLATALLTNTGTIIGSVLLGAGSDYLSNSGAILGNIAMGEGNNYFDGSAGTAPASVSTGNGTDILLGGAGNDTLTSAGGEDRISGGGGNDLLIDGGANDTLAGQDGQDTLSGGAGDDDLSGGAGDDLLIGGAGADELDGGDGRDTASYGGAAGAVLVDLTDETLNQGEARGDLYTSIEAVEGSSHDDTLLGATGNDTLDGNAGNDVIDGRGGNDLMRGGAGNDLYTVGSAKDRVVERAGRGNDTVEALASYALSPGAEVEVLRARAANGSTAMNLTGSDTDNTITGNAGANLLRGMGGNDTLNGLGGDDILAGGTGFNQLAGGAGLDVFLFDTAPVSFTDVGVIQDFSVADDTIQLSRAIFGALPLGALAAGALADGFANVVAATRIIYAEPAVPGAARQLWYDADGSGAGTAVQFASLVGSPAITAADFVVVA